MNLTRAFSRSFIAWVISSIFISFSNTVSTSNYVFFIITFILVFVPVFIFSLIGISKFFTSFISSLVAYIFFPVLQAIYPYINLILNPSIPNPFSFLNPKQILDNQVNKLLIVNDVYLSNILVPVGFYYFLPIYVALLVADKLTGGR